MREASIKPAALPFWLSPHFMKDIAYAITVFVVLVLVLATGLGSCSIGRTEDLIAVAD